MWYNTHMTNPIEEGKLPEGVTPNTEGALELNAADYPESLHEFSFEKEEKKSQEELISKLPGEIQPAIEGLINAISRTLDAQPKGKRLSEEQLSAGVAEFQKVKLDWDRMTPEQQQAAIAEGKKAPVLGDFLEVS
jgi:hypothetical protein